MKTLKYEDIKNLKKEELIRHKKKADADLFEAKMKHSLGQVGSPIEIRKLRKARARLETVLSERRRKGDKR